MKTAPVNQSGRGPCDVAAGKAGLFCCELFLKAFVPSICRGERPGIWVSVSAPSADTDKYKGMEK